MKFLLLLSFILQISVNIFSQNQTDIDISEFDHLSVSGNINLEIVNSDQTKLIFEDKNPVENVDVNVSKGILIIKGKTELGKDPALNLKLLSNQTINQISVAKGGRILSTDTLRTKDLVLKASTGGKMEIYIDVQSVESKITQGSDIIIYGKTNSQKINVTAWGNYLAYDLESNDTYVKATSGGQAKVIARRIIDATAGGKSFIGYIGEPESTYVKTSLGGKIAAFKSKAAAIDDH